MLLITWVGRTRSIEAVEKIFYHCGIAGIIQLTFLIGCLLGMKLDVILCFRLYSLYNLTELGWNFLKATLQDVLINNDEVCGFGVIRDLPLAF